MSDITAQVGPQPRHEVGHHETDDVSYRSVIYFGVGLTVFTVLVAIGLVVAMYTIRHAEDAGQLKDRYAAATAFDSYPSPRLQGNPASETPGLLAAQRARLSSYGWSPENSTARIPISRAIELISERGLPKSTEAETSGEPTPDEAVRRARSRELPK